MFNGSSLPSRDPLSCRSSGEAIPAIVGILLATALLAIVCRTVIPADQPPASRGEGPAASAPAESKKTAAKPSLKQALAELKVPPDWFNDTTPAWDTNKPWKEARLEVRRLLAIDDEAKVREAVKLTWLYAQKGDIGDGHELPMYLLMSGQYAWAIREYPKYLKTVAGKGPAHAYLCYASCLAHFGEYPQALGVANEALKDLPAPPWRLNAMGNIQNFLGDLHTEMGDTAKARAAYAEAIKSYLASDQPYGKHLIARNVAKVQTKVNLLTLQDLQNAKLRDGPYVGKSVGYTSSVDLEVTVTIKDGKIADVQVKHQEKLDLGATRTIPQRIVESNSLKVDAVTGATVTSQAIVDAAYQALKKAGLE